MHLFSSLITLHTYSTVEHTYIYNPILRGVYICFLSYKRRKHFLLTNCPTLIHPQQLGTHTYMQPHISHMIYKHHILQALYSNKHKCIFFLLTALHTYILNSWAHIHICKPYMLQDMYILSIVHKTQMHIRITNRPSYIRAYFNSWAGDPLQRPPFSEIVPKLTRMYEKITLNESRRRSNAEAMHLSAKLMRGMCLIYSPLTFSLCELLV